MIAWRRPVLHWPVWLAAAFLFVAVLAGLLALGAYRDVPALQAVPPDMQAAGRLPDLDRLERSLAAQHPRGVFVTVNTVANQLRVMRGRQLMREAVCSTGSGWVLEHPPSGRRWVFDTPRGVHTVIGKRRDPVWVRPDWSFLEEGSQPPARWGDRVDHDVLGGWALDLGDGYMIHGTLFQRYLGRNVTHGCIRLGDEDLEWAYRNVPVGARVLVF